MMLVKNGNKNDNCSTSPELAKFKILEEQIVENCAQIGRLIGGDGADKFCQQLMKSILGEKGGKKGKKAGGQSNAFLASPFHFMVF
jgi:hypothetical protein